jgi:sulfate adenylyltransferase
VIGKNYGCTHIIVPEHGAAGEANDRLLSYSPELGVTLVQSRSTTQAGATGTWVTSPSVVRELQRRHRPRSRQGFTVFLTGLSGSGKSTIANAMLAQLLERDDRSVTLLDGDLVRKLLSSELGFSRVHRDLHVRRIGYVAAEITKSGGIAICCPIAPYDATRKEARRMIASYGGFVLVFVSAPLAVCEQRDRKGLYAKARAGLIQQFTGISDPYEEPEDAEIVIDTTSVSPSEAGRRILGHLGAEGYFDDALTF